MAENGKRRGLTPEQWVEVRKAYEAGESEQSLSKRFSVRRQTIRNRKRKDAWTVQVVVQVDAKATQERAQAKVIDIATRQAVETAQQNGTLDAVAEHVAAELLATSEAGRLAGEYMVDILSKAKTGKIRPASSPGEQTEADVAKAVMSAFRTFQTTVRENHGLQKTTPSIPQSGTGKVDEVRLVVVGLEKTGTES